MGKVEKRIEELGIVLPKAPDAMASYVVVQRAGDMLYFSGASPMKDGKPTMEGILGRDFTIEEGYDGARQAGLLLLSQLKKAVGDLDQVEQIVKIFGVVASSDDFFEHPAVINGTSDLFVEVFGEKGKHARTAMGTSILPWNLPLEVEMIVKVKVE